MLDTNFNVKSFSRTDGFYSCTLATGEVLKDVNAPIRLYGWINESNEVVLTKTKTPTIENKAMLGIDDTDLIEIAAVEGDTITVLDEVYTRDSSYDIELV